MNSNPLPMGGNSYADLLKTPQASVQSFPLTSMPLKKEGFVSIWVDPVTYQSRLKLYKNSLLGNVLSIGECPWKLVELKPKLGKHQMILEDWRLISLGKYYFQIILKSLGTRTRGIGVLLRLDKATIDGGFRNYARVLVDVDMSHLLPSSVLLERDEFLSSFISVEFSTASSGPTIQDDQLLSDSKAELHFIPDSSWAKQVESEDLNSDGLNQRTKTIKHRNNSLKRVLKDLCCSHRPSLVYISEPIVAFDSISFRVWSIPCIGRPLQENSLLVAIPSVDVIHDAMFTMDSLSTPGPDGFSSCFFQYSCEIVGRDMILAVQDFFHSGVVSLGLNSNFIILLPKMRDSIMVDQFHPIVLGNFLFKISSKILANRLAQVADRIVSP
ncbi:hypothetical protein Ddye_016439 [Dipteronia dyeriana]|uniref:Uncharacterized protein n=1 Tax=Dipteronia dyeriana TaxID=168575 RepID=A0AAD9U6S9_9ROSI|nr:hypothetical protein Ddye_016439 [Dipteronia dyeriana]